MWRFLLEVAMLIGMVIVSMGLGILIARLDFLFIKMIGG